MSTVVHEPTAALDRLRRARRVLITSHSSPDGDSLGSELALAELLGRLGIACQIVNRDPAPANLAMLPGADQVTVSASLPDDLTEAFDLVAMVECPDIDRPGLPGLDRLPIVNIDHHKANTCYGEVNYLDEESPAVGEMVWRTFLEADVAPSPAAATNMFVALSTDTGDFRYPNTTGRAFRAAAALADAGAEPAEVAGWIHERRSAASVRLLGEALATLDLLEGGRLAVFSVDASAFSRAGAQPGDTEDLISAPRTIAGVQVVAFFKQWEPGIVRVSLRSKGEIDVRRIAAEFGGGGHTNAAGCTFHAELDRARHDMTARLVSLLSEES